MEEESFRRVVRFLLGFVEKVSLQVSLVTREQPINSFLGQACEATRGEVGSPTQQVRERATVERRRVCAWPTSAQERGHH